ncbi:MAG: Fe-S oxidoreductase [Paenibacillaceae bacterium]|jgi:radical SAM protein with 4Fe4S-binding SPASM domain|nr:Fe-S oxidoreductase [Paenibacillaceae bacterium]
MRAFKKIYIEITNVCNLNCSFCPQTKRKAQFMEESQFHRILEKIRPYTDYVYLHVKGEPLLHPRLGRLLDISYEHGMQVNLTTNGTLIEKNGPLLLEKPALRQINISLHSMEEHREQGEAYQHAYIRSVLAFAETAAVRKGIFVSLRLWNIEQLPMKKNVADPAANCRNRLALRIIEEKFGLDYRIEERVVPGSGVKLAGRLYLNQDYQFQWPSLTAAEDDGTGFCHGLRSHAAILADGTVVPCCLDGEGVVALGNIHTAAFADIIEGERAQRIFEGFSRKTAVEELCRRCGFRQKFGRAGHEQGAQRP